MHTRTLHFIFISLLLAVLSACQAGAIKQDQTTSEIQTEEILPGIMPSDDGQNPLETELADFDSFEQDFEPADLSSPAHETVWQHLRAGFKLESHIDKKLLQSELAWYAEHKDYIQRVMLRSDPFLHYILSEAEKRGMPTELVLLPIVESAFQPFAYSHGRASGLWQFIPATGRQYGLKQNWWYDGRRDI